MRIEAPALLRGVRTGVLAVAALVASHEGTALAAGVEDTATGAAALGRSANFVRANDFMAVWQNPANLALLPSRDFGLELRLPFFHGCFERKRDPSVMYLASEQDPFPEVCNDAAPMVAGNVGFSMPLPKGFGFGVGVFTPGGISKLKFGGNAINSLGIVPELETNPTVGAVESPTRFLLIERSVTAAFLMAGVGYAPTRYLRAGLSVGAGFTDVKFSNVTSLIGGTFSDLQVRSDVQVLDAFVPRATFSVGATPIDSIDLMASFTWNDDISADGTLDVTANGFEKAPRKSCADQFPGPHCRVEDVKLEIPYQRFEVVLGARYAQRRNARDRVLDPIKDEVWDVELDGYWSQTGQVDNFTLKIHEGAPGTPEERGVAFSSAADAARHPLPFRATLFHGWRDTYGVRLGGDYNVIQSRLALRAGVAWESSGVPNNNMNIDYWPVSKVALSLGGTVALGRWKIAAAYAHVFNQSITVDVGRGNVKEVVVAAPELAQAANEGKYTSSIDVFSLQGNVSF